MVITFAQQLGWTVESLSAPVSRGVPITFEPAPTGPVPVVSTGAPSGPLPASASPGRTLERDLDRRLLVSNVRVLESSSGFYDVVFDLDSNGLPDVETFRNVLILRLHANSAQSCHSVTGCGGHISPLLNCVRVATRAKIRRRHPGRIAI